MVTEFGQLVSQPQVEILGSELANGVCRAGCSRVGPSSGEPVAFLNPYDTRHTERISFEEWPGSVRAFGDCRERTRSLVRRPESWV